MAAALSPLGRRGQKAGTCGARWRCLTRLDMGQDSEAGQRRLLPAWSQCRHRHLYTYVLFFSLQIGRL